MRVFHISNSWWSFTGIWDRASLLKSPRLFSVFWLISITQLFSWSPLVPLFPSPPILVQILWWLYQEPQLQLVSPLLLCSTLFSNPLKGPCTYSSFKFLSILLCPLGQQSPQFCKFSFFLIVNYYKVWSSGRH